MSGSREIVLARIRAALADVPPDEAPSWEAANLGSGAARPISECLELLTDRLTDYRADVTRAPSDGAAIAAAVADVCARHGARHVVVPRGLPADWVPDAIEVLADDPEAPLSNAALDGADGVLTSCALAIAATGTLVLDSGVGQGRRVATLLPDLHICVVRAEQVVWDVPAATAVLEATVLASGRPLTLVSGPSATSDIELRRVEGVHGPRRLEVVLAG